MVGVASRPAALLRQARGPWSRSGAERRTGLARSEPHGELLVDSGVKVDIAGHGRRRGLRCGRGDRPARRPRSRRCVDDVSIEAGPRSMRCTTCDRARAVLHRGRSTRTRWACSRSESIRRSQRPRARSPGRAERAMGPGSCNVLIRRSAVVGGDLFSGPDRGDAPSRSSGAAAAASGTASWMRT